MDFLESLFKLPAVMPALADVVSVFTGPELVTIAILALLPAMIGPLPILVDLLIRGERASFVPYAVMAFWTLAAAIPMALSAFGVLRRSRMLFGGYDFALQILLLPSFLFPVFFSSAFMFSLAIGVARPRLFFAVWLAVGAVMSAPWFVFAFYGL